jgi:hypothetical protein
MPSHTPEVGPTLSHDEEFTSVKEVRKMQHPASISLLANKIKSNETKNEPHEIAIWDGNTSTSYVAFGLSDICIVHSLENSYFLGQCLVDGGDVFNRY